MAITNLTRSVDFNNVQWYLGHPAGRNIDDGYYIVYSASNAANTINLGTGQVKGYRWGTPLSSSTDFLQLDGTIQLVSESFSGSANFVNYHGSNIIHIGRGVNDITQINEDDALFFSHMGQHGATLQSSDDFFYWDRLFLQEGTTAWDYYNYHAHNPSSYVQFNNGRMAFGADYKSGPPGIEQYAHMIQTNVSSMGTQYQSVLARIHTPSVGGAHNSHNDVELPSVVNKNYMMGGIMNGTSDRFHAFYIAANGADWNVYSRTYVYANSVFNAEINHGVYDLADPQFSPITTPRSQSLYPVRASAGKLFESNIYIPVLYRSGSTAFDVNVWSFPSQNNLPELPTVTTVVTGSTIRPDCHLAIANNTLYAAVSDIPNGGVDLYKLSGSTWINEGNIVTNHPGRPLRVHGIDFNTTEFKFYVMISGQISGSGTNYSGSGVYSFTPDIPFEGYFHVDYLTGSNSFIIRDPLEAGYVQYDSVTGAFKRSSDTEPRGIDPAMPVIQFGENSPQFYNRKQNGFGGNEGFNHGIQLQDGRYLFCGTKADVDPEFDISYTNGIFAIYSPGDTSPPEYYEVQGRFDDFITGVVQSTGSGLVYFVGFTKDELVPKSQILIHGIGRGLIPAMTTTNKLEYVDMVSDTQGSQYYVGNHIDSSSIIMAKYNLNFELEWQREISGGSLADTAYGIARSTSGSLFIVGKTTNSGSGNEDALLMRLNSTSGSLEMTKLYGTTANQYASNVAIVRSGSAEYVVMPIVSGSTTTIMVTDLSGSVVSQNQYTNFIINRIRNHEQTADGRFTIAGQDSGSPSTARFGVGNINNGTTTINWVRSYTSASVATVARDMRNTGDALEYFVAGSEGERGFVMKLIETSSTVTNMWTKSVSGSAFNALVSTQPTLPSASRFVYVVGYTSASGDINQGGFDGLIARFDNHSGSMTWINALGHTGAERINAIERDITNFNIITAGWSESHTEGRRGLLFRAANDGFGTGNHHLEGAPGMALWYVSSSVLTDRASTGTLSTITPPTGTSGTLLMSSSIGFTAPTSSFMNEVYEGSLVFDGYMGVIDLNDLQEFKNTDAYVEGALNRLNELVQLYQIGVAGNGQADDGNIFGYDIIELTSGEIAIIAQASGDVAKFNTGDTGVYDYLAAVYNPYTQTFRIWQNGSALDEEVYTVTQVSTGDIVFVGRTAGDLAEQQGQGSVIGGYDIFLGVMDPATIGTPEAEADYYVTGSGQNDRALGVHDLYPITGETKVIVVYETAGSVGDATNAGPDDIGVITFDYDTDEWGTPYQVGSTQNEFLDTLGHVSTITQTGRVCIVGSTTGVFADDGNSFGGSDIFLAIFDINTNTWKKYQIGTGAADFGRSVELGSGDKLLIGGSTAASFIEPNDVLAVEFNIGQGFKGRTT
jgi:hypothetical protein